MLNEVSPLDRHALLKFTLVAAVPSFAPAGNDVRAEEDFHAPVKLVQLLMSISPNELSEVHEFQAKEQLVAVGIGVLKEVSPLDCHAAEKFTFVAAVPSFMPAGKDVRAAQDCHALEKLAPLLMSSAGNDVRAVQLAHDNRKFVPLLVSMKGKEVSEPQPYHA